MRSPFSFAHSMHWWMKRWSALILGATVWWWETFRNAGLMYVCMNEENVNQTEIDGGYIFCQPFWHSQRAEGNYEYIVIYIRILSKIRLHFIKSLTPPMLIQHCDFILCCWLWQFTLAATALACILRYFQQVLWLCVKRQVKRSKSKRDIIFICYWHNDGFCSDLVAVTQWI